MGPVDQPVVVRSRTAGKRKRSGRAPAARSPRPSSAGRPPARSARSGGARGCAGCALVEQAVHRRLGGGRALRWASDHLATANSCACEAPSQPRAASGDSSGAPTSRCRRNRSKATSASVIPAALLAGLAALAEAGRVGLIAVLIGGRATDGVCQVRLRGGWPTRWRPGRASALGGGAAGAVPEEADALGGRLEAAGHLARPSRRRRCPSWSAARSGVVAILMAPGPRPVAADEAAAGGQHAHGSREAGRQRVIRLDDGDLDRQVGGELGRVGERCPCRRRWCCRPC